MPSLIKVSRGAIAHYVPHSRAEPMRMRWGGAELRYEEMITLIGLTPGGAEFVPVILRDWARCCIRWLKETRDSKYIEVKNEVVPELQEREDIGDQQPVCGRR